MNHQKLIGELEEFIVKEDMDKFFDKLSVFLNAQSDSYESQFKQLQNDWNTTLFEKKFGLLHGNQPKLAFLSIFRKFEVNVINEIPEIKEETIIDKYQAEFGVDLNFATLGSNASKTFIIEDHDEPVQQNIGVRPVLITIICALGMVGLLHSLYSVVQIAYLGNIFTWIALVSLVQVISKGIELFGLWNMKKWSVSLFIANTFVNSFILFLGGIKIAEILPTEIATFFSLYSLIIYGLIILVHLVIRVIYFERMT